MSLEGPDRFRGGRGGRCVASIMVVDDPVLSGYLTSNMYQLPFGSTVSIVSSTLTHV